MQTRILAVLVIALLSASCSGAIAPPPPAPPKSVVDSQLKAIDKAKAVQDTVIQQKLDTDKKIEAAEGASPDADKKDN